MQLIIVSNRSEKGHIQLGAWPIRFLGVLLLGLAGALVYLGTLFNEPTLVTPDLYKPTVAWREVLETQRQAIAEARRHTEDNLNALALRLGQLQARVIRLDALGQRLVELTELEGDEFDFSSPEPAMGGPAPLAKTPPLTENGFLSAMDEVSQQLEESMQQLSMLEDLLMNRKLQDDVKPEGRPIRKGWISSFYGRRVDPLTGKNAFHSGIDFAGWKRSAVLAVAAGVVTYSGKKQGYGRIIEITHENGLITKYAHNQKNLVSMGDKVAKGEKIALMGDSGRATGPHVHFEVIRDGRTVNPIRYIKASR